MMDYLIIAGISLLISLIVSVVFILFYHRKKRHKLYRTIRDRKEELELEIQKKESELKNQLDKLKKQIDDLDKNNDSTASVIKNDSSSSDEKSHSISQGNNQKTKREVKEEKYGKKKKSINNDSKEQQKVNNIRPDDVVYSYLNPSDGRLISSNSQSAAYYRTWTFNGMIYYEFYCDESKMSKAINNRSALIEPFCTKDQSSSEADYASFIETVEPGVLDNNDYAIIKKTIIKYT